MTRALWDVTASVERGGGGAGDAGERWERTQSDGRLVVLLQLRGKGPSVDTSKTVRSSEIGVIGVFVRSEDGEGDGDASSNLTSAGSSGLGCLRANLRRTERESLTGPVPSRTAARDKSSERSACRFRRKAREKGEGRPTLAHEEALGCRVGGLSGRLPAGDMSSVEANSGEIRIISPGLPSGNIRETTY